VKCCNLHPSILVTTWNVPRWRSGSCWPACWESWHRPDLGEELLVLAPTTPGSTRFPQPRALRPYQHVVHSAPRSILWRTIRSGLLRLRAVSLWAKSRTSEKSERCCTRSAMPYRYVRQRAAWALARMEPQLEQILEDVVATNDDYALQALISELDARERSRTSSAQWNWVLVAVPPRACATWSRPRGTAWV